MAALLGIPADVHAEAAEPMPGPAVVVRFYKTTIPAEEFSAARRLAAGILDGAGIAVSWSGCWSDAGSIAPGCQRPPAVQRGDPPHRCRDGRQCHGPIGTRSGSQ